MYVFTSEWVRAITSRYGHLPTYMQDNTAYHLVTSPRYAELRNEVESWVGDLESPTRDAFIHRLQTTKGVDQFLESYNELAVRSILARLRNTKIEYEAAFSDSKGRVVTPDWTITSPGGDFPKFVVEVFTDSLSDSEINEDLRWNHLTGRLQELPFRVGLSIGGVGNAPDQLQTKRIVREARRWLNSDPSLGESIEIENVSLKILTENTTYSKLQFMGPVRSFLGNLEPLRRKLTEKITKYDFLGKLKIPLIIAVVPHSYARHGFDDLFSAVCGSDAVQFTVDENTGAIVSSQNIRMRDGLPLKRMSALTGIMWLSKQQNGWGGRGVLNSHAENSLPTELIESMLSPVSTK